MGRYPPKPVWDSTGPPLTHPQGRHEAEPQAVQAADQARLRNPLQSSLAIYNRRPTHTREAPRPSPGAVASHSGRGIYPHSPAGPRRVQQPLTTAGSEKGESFVPVPYIAQITWCGRGHTHRGVSRGRGGAGGGASRRFLPGRGPRWLVSVPGRRCGPDRKSVG